MQKSFIHELETKEVIDKLRRYGLSKLVDVCINQEEKCYTKRGRMNKSGTCREADLKTKELEDMLERAREILSPEFGD